MPLKSFPGSDVADLERAVADVERKGGRVAQVVGNMAGAWWLLVDRKQTNPRAKATAKETRS